jgi:hypothetical protein
MAQIASHFTDILNEWQSVTMIPVVLELLREELNYQEGRINANAMISLQNIPAYQVLYQHWQNDNTLNTQQQSWIKQIGAYLHILNQSIANI